MSTPFNFTFKILTGAPFKKEEIDEWIKIMDECARTRGDYIIELSEYYYEEHRGADAGLFLFLLIQGIADILTIALALRELLKRKPELKEITIKVGDKEIKIKGNIEDSELVKIIRESGRIE